MKTPAGSRKSEHSTPTTPWESIDPNEPAGVAVLSAPTDEPEVAVYTADDLDDDSSKSPPISRSSHSTSDALQRAAADLQTFNRDHEFDFTRNESATPVVSEFALPDEMIEALDTDQSAPRGNSEVVGTTTEDTVKSNDLRVPIVAVPTALATTVHHAIKTPIIRHNVEIEEPAITEVSEELTSDETAEEAATVLARSNDDSDNEVDEDFEEELITYEPAEARRWEDPELEEEAVPATSGAGWTIPVLCAGIALIACCVVIPQADANRRMAYEKQLLQADLESVQKQVVVNDEFLKRVMDDPSLSERLAQRQLKRVRKGQQVLHLENEKEEMSPFQIVAIAPPPSPAPYRPVGGVIASLCYEPRTRLYVMGAAMTMIAWGLVMGATKIK